ncbi:response regulator [bacterium]|nr:response regulator [bacterium]
MKKQMLIVDDNHGLKEALKLVFEEDYELLFAATGEDAVKVSYAKQPSVILMDYKMPGINGIEAMQMVKKFSPDSQMVVMSAYDDQAMVANCFRGGASDFVGKPFDIHEVQDVVKHAAGSAEKTIAMKNIQTKQSAVISQNEVNDLIDETLRMACI